MAIKQSIYKSYDELPLFLRANSVTNVLDIAPSSAYELMHESDFPVLRIGNRMVVPKEKIIEWIENRTGKGALEAARKSQLKQENRLSEATFRRAAFCGLWRFLWSE